ncbi:iron transporter [Streptosporangiaceae bacterium NEAU-GS5]|nr:iron transporter [Streptosporangiaceae bacterium NEAU-GS5]
MLLLGPPGQAAAASADTTAEITADTAADTASVEALLRCCLRELPGWDDGPHRMLRLGGVPVRARVRGLALRFDGRPEALLDGGWEPLTSDRLASLAQAALFGDNAEFAAQVAGSRATIAEILAARRNVAPPADPWLASEQALVAGHPCHPSPKSRAVPLAYAPETHARFPLRLLAVRAGLVAEEGDVSALDRIAAAPEGYVLLPAHPYQVELLAPDFGADLVDLGPAPADVVPTSSVRTVYDPLIDKCLKFSLNVRITNCVRKNAWYELSGAVELSSRLGPVFADLAARFPGTAWLPEPGYRSVRLGTRLLEGLGVLIRCSPWGRCAPGVTPILAGALATGFTPLGDPVAWWRAYVERVALPVLDAYARHGVVLEPHLQNVLIGLDADGSPVQAVFRDMEGTKLIAGRHDLPPGRVSEAMTYDAERGWDRVVYCLFVNHLAEIAATLGGEERLWPVAREVIAEAAETHGWPLDDLLTRPTLPAKANLSVRWARLADRAAGYVPVRNPLLPC